MKIPLLDELAPIASPPWTEGGRKIESKIRKAIYEFALLEGVEKLGIALSGGKDSLTMLYMLKAIVGFGVKKCSLHAFFVAGEFSCGPALTSNFLQKVCDKLEVPLTLCTSTRTLDELECYSCSRERRRLLFAAAAKEEITTMAFGHHRDDSIQTLLMNLLHKGEFAANLAKVPMVDYGVTIIRPLLFVTEAEIKNFAQYHKFARIVCQCPVGQNSMRKKAENLLLEVEKVFPEARQNLFQASLKYGSKKALRND